MRRGQEGVLQTSSYQNMQLLTQAVVYPVPSIHYVTMCSPEPLKHYHCKCAEYVLEVRQVEETAESLF